MSVADVSVGDIVVVRWGASRVTRGYVTRVLPGRIVLRAASVPEVIPTHTIKAVTVVVAAGRAA